MPGVFMRFTVGQSGGSGTDARYITRPTATDEDRDAILLRNIPDEVREAEEYGELRDQLEEYCRQQEAEELARPRRGGGETRTYYKAILSFEERVDTEQARDLADEWLEREFPDAEAIAAVHQDTDNTHVHVHIEARDIHNHKVHLDQHDYERLDEEWAEIYGREFGRDKTEEHEERKAETREWKAKYARAMEEGHEPPPAPERADRPFGSEEALEREGDLYDRDETGTGGHQRGTAAGEHALEESADSADRALQAVDRADGEARDTVHAAEDVVDRFVDRADRERDLDRDDDRGR